ADRNRSHWSTSKTPSYTKSVSWQHHPIVKDRYYRNDRIVEFANMIRDLDQECGSTCAADFRDRLGVGRKLAIQILEYFDRIGFTRRRGNDHLLRDALLFPEK
ncbi:SelB domain-containing protein, partial [Escherichia coli]